MNTTTPRTQHDLTRRAYDLVLEDGTVKESDEMIAVVAEHANEMRASFGTPGRWQLVGPAVAAVSVGHIGFYKSFEYFWAANGDLYRANKNNPLDTSGYRMGARFESTKHAADYFLTQAGLR
jgi:hypothetical protein